jgi:hypothetical protein
MLSKVADRSAVKVGHNRSFTTRPEIAPRPTCERQVSGDESGAFYGSARPSAGIRQRLLRGGLIRGSCGGPANCVADGTRHELPSWRAQDHRGHPRAIGDRVDPGPPGFGSDNACENAIRPFVVGRRIWLFADTVAGANASANLYSLLQTCRVNGIDGYRYLRALLIELPRAKTVEDFETLLPWRLATAER